MKMKENTRQRSNYDMNLLSELDALSNLHAAKATTQSPGVQYKRVHSQFSEFNEFFLFFRIVSCLHKINPWPAPHNYSPIYKQLGSR